MTTSVARLLSVAMVTMVMACGCQCGTNGEDTVMDHQQELLARLTAAPAGSDNCRAAGLNTRARTQPQLSTVVSSMRTPPRKPVRPKIPSVPSRPCAMA